MIYHGFHYEPRKAPAIDGPDAGYVSTLRHSRLFIGFGLSGLILALIAVIFLFIY